MIQWEHKEIGSSKIFMDLSNIVLIQNNGQQITITNEEFNKIIIEYQKYHNKNNKQ